MTRYFSNVKTAEELKKAFRELAKKLHPDCGGDAEAFKAMRQEYAEAWERVKNHHVNAEGEHYEKETEETPEQFMDIVSAFIHFEDLTVEVIGSWLWVTGNTQEHREELKSAGLKYAGRKQAWYFHFGTYRKKSKKQYPWMTSGKSTEARNSGRGGEKSPGKSPGRRRNGGGEKSLPLIF